MTELAELTGLAELARLVEVVVATVAAGDSVATVAVAPAPGEQVLAEGSQANGPVSVQAQLGPRAARAGLVSTARNHQARRSIRARVAMYPWRTPALAGIVEDQLGRKA